MGGITTSTSVTVQAPCALVWETIADLEMAPEILTCVKSFQRTGGGEFEVGTRWRETRECNGDEEIVLNKIITDIVADEGNQRQLCITVSFLENDSFAKELKNAQNTSTLVIQPIGDTSCELIGTFGVEFSGVCATLAVLLCGCCIVKLGRRRFREELEEYAVEAQRRYEQQSQDR